MFFVCRDLLSAFGFSPCLIKLLHSRAFWLPAAGSDSPLLWLLSPQFSYHMKNSRKRATTYMRRQMYKHLGLSLVHHSHVEIGFACAGRWGDKSSHWPGMQGHQKEENQVEGGRDTEWRWGCHCSPAQRHWQWSGPHRRLVQQNQCPWKGEETTYPVSSCFSVDSH